MSDWCPDTRQIEIEISILRADKYLELTIHGNGCDCRAVTG
jgi:hypothetical protein